MEKVLGGASRGASTTRTSISSTASTRSWCSKKAAVKKASRHVSQGAGVRAQAGTRTGYAHTDDITMRNLEEAARQARSIADRATASTALATPGAGRPHDLYTLDEPPILTDLARKLELLRKVDAAARAADPRVRQVIASVASEEVVTLIATITGWSVGDVRPLTRLNVTTIAEDGGKREIGTYGGGGACASTSSSTTSAGSASRPRRHGKRSSSSAPSTRRPAP
jgi:TldD protein